MNSTIESSYGAKLRKAQDLLTLIQGFNNFTPPPRQESLTAYAALIESISNANSTTATNKQLYKDAVADRQSAYKGNSASIDKLLAPIRGAVDAQFGKNSSESKGIATIVKNMRATKLIKLPADPTKNVQAKTVSQSERSYGSIIQNFSDIINTLKQIQGYSPSNTVLSVESLLEIQQRVSNLNNVVVQQVGSLKNSQKDRADLYAELKERTQRIKAYIKAQYGMNSNEYQLTKGIKI